MANDMLNKLQQMANLSKISVQISPPRESKIA